MSESPYNQAFLLSGDMRDYILEAETPEDATKVLQLLKWILSPEENEQPRGTVAEKILFRRIQEFTAKATETYQNKLAKDRDRKSKANNSTELPRNIQGASTELPRVFHANKDRDRDREKDTDKSNTPPSPSTGGCGFEALWQIYPKKTAEKSARREWDRIIRNGIDPSEIIKGFQAQAHDNRDKQVRYFPSLAKWLKDEGWKDVVGDGEKTLAESIKDGDKRIFILSQALGYAEHMADTETAKAIKQEAGGDVERVIATKEMQHEMKGFKICKEATNLYLDIRKRTRGEIETGDNPEDAKKVLPNPQSDVSSSEFPF